MKIKKNIKICLFILFLISIVIGVFYCCKMLKENEVINFNLFKLSQADLYDSSVEVIKFDSIDSSDELKEVMNKFDKEIEENNILNISECSEEFMEKYFEESANFNEDVYENIDNLTKDSELRTLIVTAKSKLSDNYGAVNVVEAPNNQYFLKYNTAEETENAYEKFGNSKEVISVDYDGIVNINMEDDSSLCSDDIGEYNSWGIESMGLDKVIPYCPTNNEIVVGIIDTGCDVELFNNNYNGKLKGTYNVLNNTEDVTDNVRHGTHIAGTIAEGTSSNVKILVVKVSDKKAILESDIINALNYVIYTNKVDVINMSFGSEVSGSKYVAFKAANSRNIISVAASGNEGENYYYYPASYDNTISVGAYDNENYEKGTFSNYNSEITFCAPGTKIRSINGTQSGTSMATPHVACAVAALKCFDKSINYTKAVEVLRKYCFDLGVEGRDDWYGYGMITFNDVTLCNCGCSECKKIFCDNCNCSNCKYNSSINRTPTKIEFLNLVGKDLNNKNFYSLSNLSYSKVKIYYGNNNYEIKYLLDLDGAEITGYSLNNTVNQVTLSYKGLTCTGTVDGNLDGDSGWGYVSSGGLKLTSYNDDVTFASVKVLYIPSYISGNEVTKLGDNLLKNRTAITKVIIPDTIQNIGNGVFSGCSNLTKIVIPSSVTSIGTNAFSGCSNVTLYVESGSEAERYAKANNINYVYENVSVVNATVPNTIKKDYYVNDVVDISNLVVNVQLNNGSTIQITEGFEIKYETINANCFKYGDEKYTIKYNKNGIEFEINVAVTVEYKNEFNSNSLNVLLCKNLISNKENFVVIQYCNLGKKTNSITKNEMIAINQSITNITDKNKRTLAGNAKIKTGDIAKVGNKEYGIIVYGDANGDGVLCDIDDILVVVNDYVARKRATDEYKVAANLYDLDNKLDIDDILKMIKVYLGKIDGCIYNIPQQYIK